MHRPYNPGISHSWKNSPILQRVCIQFLKAALCITGKNGNSPVTNGTSAVEKVSKLWDNKTKNHYPEVKKKPRLSSSM